MNDKVKGFVLSIIDYKENDGLLQVLTKEYGIISLVAKASKKLDSKNHFLPMCIYEFIIDYKENKTIFSIHSSKLINNYFINDDIDDVAFKNILLELVIKNKDIDTYDELCFVFNHINNDNRYLLGCMFLAHIIKKFGITPVVDSCTLCQNKKVVAVSYLDGGFVCSNHIGKNMPLSIDRLKRFRLIIKGSFENYDILKTFVYDINDFSILMNFYLENAYLKLKSYEFYKSLN